MEYPYSLLQSTADLTFSAQQYLWSFFGIRPSTGQQPQRDYRFTEAYQQGPSSVLVLGGHHFQMQTVARRVAGISGAVAVAMAAYSAHRVLMDQHIDERRKKAVENANKHHFIHTLGIFFATKSRYPALTIAFFSSGILMFCGSCYAYGIWNNDKIRSISPLGGLMFILGWLSFVI